MFTPGGLCNCASGCVYSKKGALIRNNGDKLSRGESTRAADEKLMINELGPYCVTGNSAARNYMTPNPKTLNPRIVGSRVKIERPNILGNIPAAALFPSGRISLDNWHVCIHRTITVSFV